MKKYNKILGISFLAICGLFLGYLAIDQMVTIGELRKSLKTSENALERLSEQKVHQLDSIAKAKEIAINQREKVIDSLATLSNIQKKIIDKQQAALDSIMSDIPVVHGDSSYSYVNEVYPPKTEQLYRLDTFQIKKFHQVDLGFKASKNLMASLYRSLELADSTNLELNNQVKDWKALQGATLSKYDIALADNRRYLIVIDDLKGDVRREKFWKNVAGGGLVVGAVAVIFKSFK
jgi:uncharacterized coiled-coil protein SlyX